MLVKGLLLHNNFVQWLCFYYLHAVLYIYCLSLFPGGPAEGERRWVSAGGGLSQCPLLSEGYQELDDAWDTKYTDENGDFAVEGLDKTDEGLSDYDVEPYVLM